MEVICLFLGNQNYGEHAYRGREMNAWRCVFTTKMFQRSNTLICILFGRGSGPSP